MTTPNEERSAADQLASDELDERMIELIETLREYEWEIGATEDALDRLKCTRRNLQDELAAVRTARESVGDQIDGR